MPPVLRTDAVSVVGLGKLGLCLAACFAERGVRTVGVDINGDVVSAVNAGRSPIVEPDLDGAVARTSGRTLFAHTDAAPAIAETDITYILVNTPSDENGDFSNRQVEGALAALAEALVNSTKANHLFVISSTVMPGSIEGSFLPLLEKATKRKVNRGFMVAFCPDFVALGSVMKDFYHPDFVLIGESAPEAGEAVEKLHLSMCRNQPPVRRMPLVSAEMAKVCLNAYITMKISFANTVANYCEQIPGADTDLITAAIGLDKRISPYYLKGGLAFGGTCFPRDTRAFKAVAKRLGQQSHLMDATEAVNRQQDQILVDHVVAALPKGEGRVAVLGLAFKPDTPVIVESPGVKLISVLLARGIEVAAYDPLAVPACHEYFGNAPGLRFAESAAACLSGAEAAVLTVQNEEYRQAVYAATPGGTLVVIDCWRQLDGRSTPPGVEVRPWGHYRAGEKCPPR